MSTAHENRQPAGSEIAIVGVGCRFPGGVRDLDSLWQVLITGTDVITQVPAERWLPEQQPPNCPAQGSFLRDVDRFDANWFGISPREARELDPQQRLLLEVTAEAMEDSGQARHRWYGSQTSVHVGILASDYLLLHTKTQGHTAIDPYYASGKEFSFGAGRIAYTFGLRGPCMSVNSACSSALVAVHLACQGLRTGEVRTAIAGGVNLILTPELTIYMNSVQALSPTGRCRPFSAQADGVVRGEGCGVVVLKRLADALEDGDRIHAVIRSSAVNHDGHSAGLTVPSTVAQQDLLRSALRASGLGPDMVDYVEAHGTGTPLGDPLELAALAEVFGSGRPSDRPLLIGSHKANFGHLDSAAGIAGLLKTLLVVRHGMIPPQIHFHEPSPMLDWESAGLAVPTAAVRLDPDRPVLAGVSAFGLSGTNAHVLLGPSPTQSPAAPAAPDRAQLLVMSATSAAGLRQLASDYQQQLAGERDPARHAAVQATAATRRTHFPHRLAVAASDPAELVTALAGFAANGRDASVMTGEVPEVAPRVAFVFSGQGAQWAGMAVDLYEQEPVFAAALDECQAILDDVAGWSLLDTMRGTPAQLLRSTEHAQPAIFAIQVGLSRLWRSWGVRPDAVLGHSMGEVAAAVDAGALELADALRLIVARGRLMQESAGAGQMAAVELSEADAADRLSDTPEVCIAAVNGPRSVVLAGPTAALSRAVANLRRDGAQVIPLPGDYAFHSPAMAPFADRLRAELAGLRAEPPTVEFRTTSHLEPATTLDGDYWWANMLHPVRLWPAVDSLIRQDDRSTIFLEIGVHPVLQRPLTDALEHRRAGGTVAASLSRGVPASVCLARTRARLYAAGLDLDWQALYPSGQPAASLPPPRWADQRFWLTGISPGQQGGSNLQRPVSDPPRPLDGAAAVQPVAEQHAAAEAEPAAAAGNRASTPPGDRAALLMVVQAELAEVLGHPAGQQLPRTRGFFELGADSLSVVQLAARLSERLGCQVTAADVLTHSNISLLVEHLSTLEIGPPEHAVQTVSNPPREDSLPAADDRQPARAAAAGSAYRAEPIAVIGLGCRLPGGVQSPEELWQLLVAEVDTVRDVPAERWDADALYDNGRPQPGRSVTTQGGFLDQIDGFDHKFFRVSPREARSMDPQQRIFLEVAWEALEDAGQTLEQLRGSRTGIFAGLDSNDYQQLITGDPANIDLYYGTGNSFSATPGRLAYFLGTHGPCMAVDTACSSSLTAVHLGCQSLRAGESDLVVAGGSNVMTAPTIFLAMSAAGALSPDGRCKTFDDSADGYGRGEGAGAVVLKLLRDAERDGDRVYAVIRGSAINQDGASGGLTVPNGLAQRQVINSALTQSDIPADRVSYVEAHGTGTPLGDAVELQALGAVFGPDRPASRPLLVGSIKTNIGHLEAAAGIAGLLKVVLSLHHKQIPAQLHVAEPTHRIGWDELPLTVVRRLTGWPDSGGPPVAGVSAFGFTGTNAHVVLTGADSRPADDAPENPVAGHALLLALSAATPDALRASARRWVDRIGGASDSELADLCWNSATRRTQHEHRLAIVATDRAQLRQQLVAAGADRLLPGMYRGSVPGGDSRRTVAVLSSSAVPWRWLRAQAEPGKAAGNRVADLDRALTEATRNGLAATLEGAVANPDSPPPAALFAGQLMLASAWQRFGGSWDAITGSGTGQLAAEVLTGTMDLATAVRLAAGQDGPPAGDIDPLALTERVLALDPALVLVIGCGEFDKFATVLLDRSAGLPVIDMVNGGGLGSFGTDDLLHPIARVHACGGSVDWQATMPGRHRVLTLPGYPWQRSRHWIDGASRSAIEDRNIIAPRTTDQAEPVDELGQVDEPGRAGNAPRPAGLVARLGTMSPADRERLLLDEVLELVGRVLGGDDDVSPEQGFFDLGMDSVMSAQLKAETEAVIGRELPATIVFECPNALSFTRFLLDEALSLAEPVVTTPVLAEPAGPPVRPAVRTDGQPPTLPSDDDLLDRLDAALAESRDLISRGNVA